MLQLRRRCSPGSRGARIRSAAVGRGWRPYIFADEFDGPRALLPIGASGRSRPGRTTSTRRSRIYRDDRQNVFRRPLQPRPLRHTRFPEQHLLHRKLRGNFRSMINQTWKRRSNSTACSRLWPRSGASTRPLPDARSTSSSGTATANGTGTTVHAASNGRLEANRFPM